MKFKELQVVKTLINFPNDGISVGEIGTVVHCFTKPNEAYLVEFADKKGRTTAMITALPEHLELVE